MKEHDFNEPNAHREIYWNPKYSAFYIVGPFVSFVLSSINAAHYEIIGNIYENPELRIIKNEK